MTASEKARAIFHMMYDNDPYSQSMGMQLLAIDPGQCQLQLEVQPAMCNGFGIAHGGIAYSLADSALAFASNAHGRKAVSIETSISHFAPVYMGETLTATAREEKIGYKTAWYTVDITNDKGEKVALFRGTVYRRSESWGMNK
jgi:acyl-CoA thioesterase